MGYWEEKKEYENSKINQNLTEKERERILISNEEFSNSSKVGAFLLMGLGLVIFIIFYFLGVNIQSGTLMIIGILLGFVLFCLGISNLNKLRNEAWKKAVKRIPYTHEKGKK